MTRWYPLAPADAGIFTSAPTIYRFPIRLAVPPAQVWASLASDPSLAEWGATVKTVTWHNPRPFGIGTTREVVLAAGAAKVHEKFFRWDEGRGYSFFVYEASAPLFARLAENYVLEPDGDGTLFTWTVAIEAKRALALPMRLLSPVNRLAFGRIASDCTRYFARSDRSVHPSE